MATRLKPQTVELDAWRPALAAFYEREAMPQSAANVRRGEPLSVSDLHLIEALQAAFDCAPEPMRRAA